MQPSTCQVCPTAFKVAENEEGYVLRYYNMSQENVRVSEGQQTILDLLEQPYPVHSGLLATTRNPYRIGSKRRNLISKDNIKRKEERKSKNRLLIRSFLQVKAMTIATIDIGGTGIKFASLTPDGKILDKASTATPETLEELLAWLDQRLSERDYRGIAMSVPGAVHQETGVIEGISAIPLHPWFFMV